MIALTLIAVMDIFLFLLIVAWTLRGGETMITGLLKNYSSEMSFPGFPSRILSL